MIFKPVETVTEWPHAFDVVTFWDSFEHMPKAFDTLDAVEAHLAPGGIVFLRINNTRDVFNFLTAACLAISPSLGRRMVKICFNLPQHAWNFSSTAAMAMLARRGWRVLSYRFTDTPASRFVTAPAVRLAFEAAYLVNRMIGGGKIGEYWLDKR